MSGTSGLAPVIGQERTAWQLMSPMIDLVAPMATPLAAILQASVKMGVTPVNLPATGVRGRKHLAAQGVSDRCRFTSGFSTAH